MSIHLHGPNHLGYKDRSSKGTQIISPHMASFTALGTWKKCSTVSPLHHSAVDLRLLCRVSQVVKLARKLCNQTSVPLPGTQITGSAGRSGTDVLAHAPFFRGGPFSLALSHPPMTQTRARCRSANLRIWKTLQLKPKKYLKFGEMYWTLVYYSTC